MEEHIAFTNEPAVDISGTPPGRAALVIHYGKIQKLKDNIALLESGHARLTGDIQKENEAQAELEKLVKLDANNLVQKLKAGAQWALNQFGGQQVVDLSSRLAASSHLAAIARQALQTTEQEIRDAKRELEELENLTQKIVSNALEEAAKGIYDDYQTSIFNLYEAMIQLLALERLTGIERIGRTVCVVPDFTHQTIMREMAISANSADILDAVRSWKAFADDLKTDPRTPISALKFNPVSPNGRPDSIAYEAMHPVEQRAIDVDRAFGM